MNDEARTVLLCYDGSEQARNAVAVTAAMFPGARTEVLHVWEPIERIVARYAALAPFMGEELTDADTSVEAESAKVAAAGAALAQEAGLVAGSRTAELESTVWGAILAVAAAIDADVIVTGTRSLHGLREMVSNTLSHALIQHSARPVLAIPMPVSEETG